MRRFPAATSSTEWMTAPSSRNAPSIASKLIDVPSMVSLTVSVSWSTSSRLQLTPSMPLRALRRWESSMREGRWGFRTSRTRRLRSLAKSNLPKEGADYGVWY